MHGLVLFLDSHSPIWVVPENSDDLAEEENIDWNTILLFFESRGYRCHTCIIVKTELSFPTRRRSAYLVALAIASKRYSFTNATFPKLQRHSVAM